MDVIKSNSVLMSQKVLDFLWEKQKITNNNIANAETPGFKSQYVTFEGELKNRISSAKNNSRSNIRNEILNSRLSIHDTKNESCKLDGNNVNLDVENVELARTTLQYEYMLRTINDEFSRVKTAIKGQ